MERKLFRTSEVISFLEYKLEQDINTYDELLLYQHLKWEGKLIKNETYKNLVIEMKAEYYGEF